MMILPIVLGSALTLMFMNDVLYKPKRKTPEDELGRALTKYLKSKK